MSLALLVDRDTDTRQMYAAYLQQSLGEIDEAEDGREALAKALTRHPDVIVTETRLPGLSGFDLCRLLRSDTTTHDTVIVVVTGDAFDCHVKRAETAGADTVLTKPCLPETLAAEISRLMTKRKEVRERARAAINRGAAQQRQAEDLIDRSQAARRRRRMLSHAYVRHDTATPPAPPPAIVCPTCDQPLKYVRSHVGGVSAKHPEQWDYYECNIGCGTFQYRPRTRTIRRVG